MRSEVTLFGNPVLLKLVVKPINWFRYKKRASLSTVTVSVIKWWVMLSVSWLFCMTKIAALPLQIIRDVDIKHTNPDRMQLIWGINPALKHQGP